MKEKKIITKQGLKKLEKELDERINRLRKKIADELDSAKAQGDLSENSAYISAVESYQMNETKIKDLRRMLSDSVIAPDKSGDQKIDVGDKVVLKEKLTGKVITYSIVGEGEGDPLKGQVSVNSLVGINLLGKKAGQYVKIKSSKGEREYEIVSLN